MMRPWLIVALAFSSVAGPQDPQVFRSGVDLIRIDVIVVDRQGKPIVDLTAADFRVAGGKKDRKVVSAEFVPVAIGRAPLAPAETEPPAATTSNIGLPESRSFLLVVDVEQMRQGEGRVAMRSASEFVASLGSTDRVGVVALPFGRPRVDLTTNRALVQQAFGSIVGAYSSRDEVMSLGEAAAIEVGDRQMMAQWEDRHTCQQGRAPDKPSFIVLAADCALGPERLADKVMREQRLHSRQLLDALRGISEAMRPLNGLKTIVLVSEGMIIDRQVRDELRRFSEAAASSRVTLYALRLDSPGTEAADAISLPADRRLDDTIRMDGMADLAHAAGGDVFMVSGTAAAALKQIDTELAGYYMISFESEPNDGDGKRRIVEVKVGRGGARVRARTDFAIPGATKAAAKPGPADTHAAMGELLRWPVAVTDVPLSLATFASPAAAGTTERRVVLAADVPAGAGKVAAGFEVVDDKGKVLSDSFEPDAAMTATSAGATYLAAVLLGPGHYQVKFGVIASDGRRGSVEHSLYVRASSLAALRPSDIIVGLEAGDAFRPLARIPPGLPGIDLRLELQANDAAAFEGAVVLLEVSRPGEAAPITSAAMRLAATANPLKKVATAALAIGRLPAGDYVLRCTIKSAQSSSERVARVIHKT